jgi:hypothetical protein
MTKAVRGIICSTAEGRPSAAGATAGEIRTTKTILHTASPKITNRCFL